MTRVAVIGVGSMGRNHARVYKEIPGADLVAVADTNQDTTDAVGNFFGVKSYTDFIEMIEKEKPEAVSIASPTSDHYSISKICLERGCHVLVEKPICATMEDANNIIQIAENNNMILSVGHIERFNPAIIELKRRLDNGDIGRVFHIHARRIGPFPSRIQDVGVILDLATHDLDIMRYITGSEVESLFAKTKREFHSKHEDLVNGIINFEKDILGLIEINWITPTKIRELYVTGELGMMKVNYITQDLFFYENGVANGEDWSTLSLLRGVSEGPVTQFVIRKMEPLRAELEAFVSAVKGEKANIVDGNSGKASLALALALLESAQAKKVVRVQ